MSNTSKDEAAPACGNPYEVLGVAIDVPDSVISKAYKDLAKKYHPDKQKHEPDSTAFRDAQRKFLAVTEAREFLLDPEFRVARQRFDARIRSERARKEEDELRERGMSERRKRMRDELAAKEGRAAHRWAKSAFAGAGLGKGDNEVDNDDRIEQLRREGRRLRERLGEREAASVWTRTREVHSSARSALERKQVRLKWSRRRLTVSHSEHSIAKLMQDFGEVESVELIGGKGNAALVTFANESSCQNCVQAFLDSDEMRATFVGQRKKEEIRRQSELIRGKPRVKIPGGETGFESLEERRIRQAGERDALRKQMKMEDEAEGLEQSLRKEDFLGAKGTPQERKREKTSTARYPPPLDFKNVESGLTPLDQLEMWERRILPISGVPAAENCLQE